MPIKLKYSIKLFLVLLFIFSVNAKHLQASDLGNLVNQQLPRIQNFFSSLNLESPKIYKVKKYVDKKNYTRACQELIKYYENSDNGYWLRADKLKSITNFYSPGGAYFPVDVVADADSIMLGIYTFQGVKGKIRLTESGKNDWLYTGPRGDVEWGYFLNRHHSLLNLLDAWLKTNDNKYASKFDELIKDWSYSNICPQTQATNVVWRVLEVGLRCADAWPKLFFGFLKSPEFSDESKILMLMSIGEQGPYIQKYHKKHHNHAAMEMVGLGQIAVCWPEFKMADEWYTHALKQMKDELDYEVLPDGVQNELSCMYHHVALTYFQSFVELAQHGKKDIPQEFIKKVEDMYSYLVFSQHPSGHSLLNGDSDEKWFAKEILEKAKLYNRPDWEYVVNFGKTGQKPAGLSSVVYPYAGAVILRSDWSEKANWAYFDAGPWGTSHQHDDKLHVSISPYGRDILVDNGRLWYKGEEWRQYFRSSWSHNVILIDGQNQKEDQKVYTTPDQFEYHLGENLQYARASYNKGYRNVDDSIIHYRTFVFADNKFWVVADYLTGLKKPHLIETLWHFHPECNVVTEKEVTFTADREKPNLTVIPVHNNIPINVKLVKGKAEVNTEAIYPPFSNANIPNMGIQGWYSVTYNSKTPAFASIYSTKADSYNKVWIMVPTLGLVKPSVDGQIIEQTEEYVRLKVRFEDKNYELKIPFEKGECIMK